MFSADYSIDSFHEMNGMLKIKKCMLSFTILMSKKDDITLYEKIRGRAIKY